MRSPPNNQRLSKMMRHPAVLELSKRFAPPKIDLRRAKILDDFGDNYYATRPIDHRVPGDVSREDLEFYADVWMFMEFDDWLFYLYPVAFEHEKYDGNVWVDHYLYALDWRLTESQPLLEPRDRDAWIEGLKWIWESRAPGDDWPFFPHLRSAISLPL